MTTVYIAHPREARQGVKLIYSWRKAGHETPVFLSQRRLWCRIDRSGSSAQRHDDGIAHGVIVDCADGAAREEDPWR
jgi:hypothetical protein